MIFFLRIYKLVILAVFIAVLPFMTAYAAPDIMAVDEVKIGMRGIAKTVVKGTLIENFDIEVLGVMKQQGNAGDLILVRASGDVIDRTGGIVQGMSGSPVYIDGKLIGAIAYGWPLKDHKITMVTPIGDMLKLLAMPNSLNSSSQAEEKLNNKAEPDKAEAKMAPLMVSGLSEQALGMLSNHFKPYQLVPYAIGEAPSDLDFPPLEPGSSIGVQLVRGDVSVEAIGTVTYMEGNKVLAFGHPFLRRGNAEYLMTNAYIFTTLSGLDNGLKMGTTGNLIGVINQDRSSGIAGEVATYPAIIPLRATVYDKNIGKTEDAGVQIVRDELLAPPLAAATVLSVIDKAMDRTGPGTAKVSFEIAARNMPGEVLKRENMFYSPGNISEAAVTEFLEAMTILAANKYNSVDIMDVKVNVSVSEEQRTAAILEATVSQKTVHPGDKIDISVHLKPFRGEKITQIVSYTVPENQPAGAMTLEVRGGGMIPLTQLLKLQNADSLGKFIKSHSKDKSFSDMLKTFTNRECNNDIVIEKLDMSQEELETDTKRPVAEFNPVSEQKEAAVKLPKVIAGEGLGQENNKAGKFKVSTNYIVENDTQLIVNVVSDKLK